MTTHPDMLELELARTREASAEVMQHLQSCTTCQQQLARLQSLRDAQAQPETIPLSVAREAMLLEMVQDSARRARTRHRQQSTVVRVLRWAAPVAAAAGLVVAISVPMTMHRSAEVAAVPPGIAGDVNADGQVNIVDALLLARSLERGDPLKLHDLDGDQVITASDVEAIARRAVALGGGGR
ncbi:MAG: dockerin type I repeat-containing protein [Pseudomonadota bacterium]